MALIFSGSLALRFSAAGIDTVAVELSRGFEARCELSLELWFG